MNSMEKAKNCQSLLNFIIFVILGVICYFYLMEDAIKKSEKGSTTITSRQEKSGFEDPAIIICPYPGFKPSLSQKLEYAAKDLFKLKTQDKSVFDNKTVPEVFEEYTYGNSIKISTRESKFIPLKEGENKFKNKFGNVTQTIELKKVPTVDNGICHVIFIDKVKEGKRTHLLVEFMNPINSSGVPERFSIYLLPTNEWQGAVTGNWQGATPFKIDTSSYSFPFSIRVQSTMNQFYPLSLESPVNTKCIDTKGIMKLYKDENCKEVCIPIQYRSLYDSSEIKICSDYDDHHCVFQKIRSYVWNLSFEKQILCTKENIEKSYKGQVVFSNGMPYWISSKLTKERRNNLLFHLDLNFHSDLVTVQEEKLLYDSKDLLAWTGGALGIFVGYSIFDLSSQILDVVFQFICRII